MGPRDLCLDGDHRQADAASLRLRTIEALDQGGLVLRANQPGAIDHGALQVLVSAACEARRRGLPVGIIDHREIRSLEEVVERHLSCLQIGLEALAFDRQDRLARLRDLRLVSLSRGVQHLVHLGVGLLAGSRQEPVSSEFVGQRGQAFHGLGLALRQRPQREREQLAPDRLRNGRIRLHFVGIY